MTVLCHQAQVSEGVRVLGSPCSMQNLILRGIGYMSLHPSAGIQTSPLLVNTGVLMALGCLSLSPRMNRERMQYLAYSIARAGFIRSS